MRQIFIFCLVAHDLRGLSTPQPASVHRALGEAVRREARRGSRLRGLHGAGREPGH